ncbi:MAG: hypothetical protein QM758_30115 [Armatimonas sp.]
MAVYIGVLVLPIFPLFILPSLALKNRQVPWFATLTLGTLMFTGVCGLSMKVNFYPHWKQFESNESVLIARLWQDIGFIAGCTFGIALIVILLCLGVRKLRQHREGGN